MNRPDDRVLRDYLIGSLATDAIDQVETWISADPSANQVLADLQADDLLTASLRELGQSARAAESVTVVLDAETTDPTTPTLPPTDDAPLELPGFRVLAKIGEGGFGIVYRAQDLQLRRQVAIKVLKRNAAARAGAKEKFLAEAQAMALVNHDHVVPIYQVGEADGVPYFVMPLLAGESLAARLEREGSLPPDEVRRIAREVALGLEAIHARGLIHRDLKPGNIWIEIGTNRVKVLDLGLAEDPIQLPQGVCAGTPGYMSPEQAAGQELDVRSDLFSLGSVLYECVAGRRAFDGESIIKLLNRVQTETPTPVSRLRPGTPSDLVNLIDALMQKAREKRPGSAHAVVDQLSPRQVPSRSRRPSWVYGAGALAMVAILVVIYSMNRQRPAHDSTPASTPATEVRNEANDPIRVVNLEVRPYEAVEGEKYRPLPSLGQDGTFTTQSSDAISVQVKLSRPAYAYIVVFQADGKDHVMYPQDADDVPARSDLVAYPSKRRDELWQLNDGAGLWCVAVIASHEPLPSYREWRKAHPGGPWQTTAAEPSIVMLDSGEGGLRAFSPSVALARGPRVVSKDTGRSSLVTLVDWLRQESKATVSALAFPVTPAAR